MSQAPSAGGGAGPSGTGQPKRAPAPLPIPSSWKVELPDYSGRDESHFFGCRNIEQAYDRAEVLGMGTYGEVYLAYEKKPDGRRGCRVAAKKIKMDNEKEGFPITAIREIKILSSLVEPSANREVAALQNNVIGLREIVRSKVHKANNHKGSIYMIFDYMDHDLTGLLERVKREAAGGAPGKPVGFPPQQAKCYMKQLFGGLFLLQIKSILHRDLKNANLLVNNEGVLKIADFGLARHFKRVEPGGDAKDDSRRANNMTNRVITLWYRPPELLLGSKQYGTEVDMWSAGCIMFELLTGRALFPGKDEADQIEKIFSVMGQPTEANMPGCTKYSNYQIINPSNPRYPPTSRLRQHLTSRGVNDMQAIDLLEKLLTLDSSKRLSARDAYVHEWFHAEPRPLRPDQMPRYESSHEMAMKRQRAERGGQVAGAPDARRQRSHAPPPPQQAAPAGGHARRVSGPLPPPQQHAPYGGGTAMVPVMMVNPAQLGMAAQHMPPAGAPPLPPAGPSGGAMRHAQAQAFQAFKQQQAGRGGYGAPPGVAQQQQQQQWLGGYGPPHQPGGPPQPPGGRQLGPPGSGGPPQPSWTANKR